MRVTKNRFERNALVTENGQTDNSVAVDKHTAMGAGSVFRRKRKCVGRTRGLRRFKSGFLICLGRNTMPTNVFLKLDDLKGGSRDKNHKDQIDVLAWSWGMSQGMSSGIGSSRKKVNVEDLSITKYIDKASPGLIRAVCSGKVFKEALLTLSNSGEKLIDY